MIENPEHSAAYKLFHYYFYVTVPQMYLYDSKFINQFGVVTSGNREVDAQQAQAPIRVQITVSAMAEYFDEGAQIGLINPQDSVRIYSYIREHLVNWQTRQVRDVNIREIPHEDLRRFEAFAKEVYKVARNFMTAAPEDSDLFKRLGSMRQARPMRRKVVVDTPAKPVVPEEHDAIVDGLVKEQMRRNSEWR